MVNYNNAKIYRLVNIVNNDIYIGSTTRSLCQRLAEHVSDYKRYINNKYHYVSSFQIIQSGNYQIELIESFPCTSKEMLHTREGYFIRRTVCINKCIAGRCQKDYHVDNADRIHQYKNQKNVCPCGGKFTISHKAKHYKTIKHVKYINYL